MAVLENYRLLQQDVADIARSVGRDPSTISTIVVSKRHSWDSLLPLYYEGVRAFGESRMPEALDKMEEAPDDIAWHFIGTLQKNKVRKAIGNFCLIHSVDSVELAEKISQCSHEMGMTTSLLIQVNTSGELTKHGLTEQDWIASFEKVLALPAVRIEGLMTMAPLSNDEGVIRRCFHRLYAMREKLAHFANEQSPICHLSMGMSHDYPLAIIEGATILRIGSLIFKA